MNRRRIIKLAGAGVIVNSSSAFQFAHSQSSSSFENSRPKLKILRNDVAPLSADSLVSNSRLLGCPELRPLIKAYRKISEQELFGNPAYDVIYAEARETYIERKGKAKKAIEVLEAQLNQSGNLSSNQAKLTDHNLKALLVAALSMAGIALFAAPTTTFTFAAGLLVTTSLTLIAARDVALQLFAVEDQSGGSLMLALQNVKNGSLEIFTTLQKSVGKAFFQLSGFALSLLGLLLDLRTSFRLRADVDRSRMIESRIRNARVIYDRMVALLDTTLANKANYFAFLVEAGDDVSTSLESLFLAASLDGCQSIGTVNVSDVFSETGRQQYPAFRGLH